MIVFFGKKYPEIDKQAWVADGAAVIGAVKMKEYSSVWYNVTVRGDVNRIEIGAYSNVQDNSCLHVSDDFGCIIGDYVTVGHCATLHACTVEDKCLIGIGATVLDGSVIGTGSIIGAGCLVTRNTIIPPNSLVVGVPGKIIKTLPPEHLEDIYANALKYKTLWAERYGFLPDNNGERYDGHKIV